MDKPELTVAPPRYLVMITKKPSSIILSPGEKEQDPVICSLALHTQDIQAIRTKFAKGDMFVFPIAQNPLTSIEEVEAFEKNIIAESFDIEQLSAVIDAAVKTTFENFRELPTNEKEILSIKAIYKMIYEADVDMDTSNLKFSTTYKEDGSLGQMLPQNMYSFLLMYGVPVKPSDVEGITEYAMPYGVFLFKDGQPGFSPYKRS